MRKLVLLIFSSWLIFAGSCSLKDLALYGTDRADIETSVHYVNKATSVSSTKTSELSEICAKNIVKFASAIVITPVQLLGALPDFTLKTVLLLVLLVFLYRHKSFNRSLPVLHRYSLRLYLQLKRIQVYA